MRCDTVTAIRTSLKSGVAPPKATGRNVVDTNGAKNGVAEPGYERERGMLEGALAPNDVRVTALSSSAGSAIVGHAIYDQD